MYAGIVESREKLQVDSTGSQRQILIAEDSPTQAAHLKRILEEHDFGVVVARDGKEALQALRRHKPHILIADILMPEIDGYELCRRIRADQRFADLPVILLTALSEPDDVFKGLECGADNFVTKPYDPESLVGRIEYLLANSHLHNHEKPQTNIEVFLAGKTHVITSDRAQILNLLLSTYEAAVERNGELAQVRDQLTNLNAVLEQKVAERTASLAAEILERKRAEAEVRKLNEQLELRVRDRTAELEATNRELEAFSYSVSHDLRSPLRAIRAFSHNLRDDFSDGLPADARGLLDRVISSAEHMTQLINDLLRFSHLSRQPLSLQPVSLSGLVREVLDDLPREQNRPDAEVRVGALPDCVGDHSLLKQVLANLLANAFKFTRHKANPLIEIGYLPEQRAYYVRDNGAGFDMRYANKLFGVFQRLHTQEQFEGTGVGLSIVHRIIQRHGGRIWAEAEVDKGAAFYFTLE